MNMKMRINFTGFFCALLFALFCAVAAAAENGALAVDDVAIVQEVQTKINADPTLANAPVGVNALNGVVILSGHLDTDTQASRIVEVAQSVPGVKDVDTAALTVPSSQQPIADSYITAKVKGAFLREKLLGDETGMSVSTIKVETKNGAVYLTGDVDSKVQAVKAVALAKEIKGVKKVVSKLQVKK